MCIRDSYYILSTLGFLIKLLYLLLRFWFSSLNNYEYYYYDYINRYFNPLFRFTQNPIYVNFTISYTDTGDGPVRCNMLNPIIIIIMILRRVIQPIQLY